MILPLILALQQPIPLTLKQIEVPIMGGMREIIVGPIARKNDTLGLYINNYDKMYDESGKVPSNFENPRIGSVSSAVRPALLGNVSCFQIDTESTRTQELTIGYERISLRMKMSRQWWVTEEGRVVAETFRLDAGGNVWTMDVKYEKETYTATLSSPDRGTRTLGPVTPWMGMDDLTTTAFRPMIRLPEEVVTPEKDYYLLDPFTGGPVKFHAKVKGKFSGTWVDDRVSGKEVEVTGGVEKQVISLSNQGYVVKAALEKYKFLTLMDRG